MRVNCWRTSGPNLSETVIWKSCSSLGMAFFESLWKFYLLWTDCIYSTCCFCLPRIPCFLLRDHPSCGEPRGEWLCYRAYCSYWPETMHSSIVWPLSPLLLTMSPIPSFISYSLLPHLGISSHCLSCCSQQDTEPFMTKCLCTCRPLSLPTPPYGSDLASTVRPLRSPPWPPTQVELVTPLCSHTSLSAL